ncbi:hypothetical protein GcM3_015040 [Golovinomyces cichoracearum]|uniref:Uncharacterized protein n=1 Tax=Golovinomyces cichoracearum TaxID=62708 RepID=A0A420J8S6_9PEZI|nr:hypothetical protein GcM3_015040 [Golovinomyces cichoracearum]
MLTLSVQMAWNCYLWETYQNSVHRMLQRLNKFREWNSSMVPPITNCFISFHRSLLIRYRIQRRNIWLSDFLKTQL